jgi:1-deoxy-D-xylulose-5-phosphate synthase
MNRFAGSEYHRQMTDFLKNLKSPADLKKLPPESLPGLAAEIREALVGVLSEVGGHLGGNLGVVELTIALHYVYNSPIDKMIWDTGHQSYVHKMLTGRHDRMGTIRQRGGLAGFAKITESEHDIYGAGHASTSISAAYGLAVSRDLAGERNHVIAIIGDGALTGGLAFEGLNNLGNSKRNMLVVLNDNSMSIDKNVGALSEYLTELLTDQTYNKLKATIWDMTGKLRHGSMIRDIVGKVDESIKSMLVPGVIFEKLGLRYFGPVDGHDVMALVKTLDHMKALQGPLLLHIRTKKGKGYKPAEDDACCLHGVSKFDKVTGKSESSGGVSYTSVFGTTMIELAEKDNDLAVITAAMPTGTGLSEYAKKYPARFFDVGIAEQHAAVFAAGLSRGGKKPVFAVYSTFCQRAYDPIVHDIALQNLPVVLALDRAGLVGNDGPTHHGCFDLSYLRPIPKMVICAPKDGTELKQLLQLAIERFDAPIAIRWPRADIPEGHLQERPMLEWGSWECMQEGNDGVILAVGTMVDQSLKAAVLLEDEGIHVTVINCRFVKPFDLKMLENLAEKHTKFITVEEGALVGGFGSGINDWLADTARSHIRLHRLGIPDQFIEHGNRSELLKMISLHPEGIAGAVAGFIKTEGKHSLKIKTDSQAIPVANRTEQVRTVAKDKT